VTFFGCKNAPEKIISDQDKWNRLTIGFKNLEVVVSNLDTCAIVRTYSNYKKTIEGHTTVYAPSEMKEKIIKIKSSDKDSIYRWTKELVSKPFKPKIFCHDYVGKLFLDIEIDEQVTQSCRYRSICEWSTINAETLKLHKLFKDILKLE